MNTKKIARAVAQLDRETINQATNGVLLNFMQQLDKIEQKKSTKF